MSTLLKFLPRLSSAVRKVQTVLHNANSTDDDRNKAIQFLFWQIVLSSKGYERWSFMKAYGGMLKELFLTAERQTKDQELKNAIKEARNDFRRFENSGQTYLREKMKKFIKENFPSQRTQVMNLFNFPSF